MILITGAGGKTGKTLISALSKIERVCAFVYRDAHVPVVGSWGAGKVIVGDMRDESAIRSAVEDARAVYHLCPNMSPEEVGIGELILREAKEAGVEHFVFHSVLHPQTAKMNHHWQKLRVEEMIFESGLPFTILQPAPYMQNLLADGKSIVEQGLLRVPYSLQARFSFVDLEDIAEAARVVLRGPDHIGATYELAGTTATSHLEAAEIFARVLNRPVQAEREETRRFVERQRARGLSEYALENLARMFEYYDTWGLVGNPNVLRWLLEREPTSLEVFAQRALKRRDAAD